MVSLVEKNTDLETCTDALPPGAVSGPKGCLVMLQDALKKPWPTIPESPSPADIDAQLKQEVAAEATA